MRHPKQRHPLAGPRVANDERSDPVDRHERDLLRGEPLAPQALGDAIEQPQRILLVRRTRANADQLTQDLESKLSVDVTLSL